MERVGIYPGTFDPVTNGHLDIASRARTLVDRLVIGVAINADKRPLFSAGERAEMILAAARERGLDATVRTFDGLLTQFAERLGARVLVRGLRAVSDFEFEFQMVGMNRAINPDIQTVFLMAGVEHQAISSKLVKEIARLGGDVGNFVPADAARRLRETFAAIPPH